MDCRRQLFGFEWEHHTWRRRVTAAVTVPTSEVTMWGTAASSTCVRCHADYVCERCGTTRQEGNCVCDASHAEHCAVRLEWLGQGKRSPSER